ncbi:RAxF-45 family protein [Paenibacillus medicaginis]|uniref:RAxF-45 family protein n=1 Tax=Paenibacillus medicaginis TaxID=1470560 RepID=A0ABV5C166_9BACL
MNFEMVNNRISQLPIAMAGIVHAFSVNGRSLSIFNDTEVTIARRRLP